MWVRAWLTRSKPILPGQPEPVETNKGAIIGGVVGGVGGAAILAALLWWFCWRKRKGKKGKGAQPMPKEVSSSNFEVDEDPYIELNDLGAARPTPYVPPSPAPTPPINTNMNEPAQNGSALRKAAMLAAASGSGHTPLLGNESAPPLSPIDVTPQHSALPSPTGLRTTHTLPSPGGISPISPTAPSPGGTLLPGTMGPHLTGMTGMSGLGTNLNEPVHPIAAELKHGSSLRRPQPQRQVAQEEDGGAVDEYELVPPVYNPAWARQRREGPSRSGFGGPNLGADPDGVPLSPSARAPPPTLSVITSSPYISVSGSGSPRSTPTSATPHTAHGSHIPSPLSAVSLHHPPLSATSTHPPSPLAMTSRLAPSDYSHESYDRQSSEYVQYDSPPADEYPHPPEERG